MPPHDVFAHCDLCVASFEMVDACLCQHFLHPHPDTPIEGGAHAADDLNNHNVRVNHMRARILVRHRHESREHGELETRVDGTHLGDVGRVQPVGEVRREPLRIQPEPDPEAVDVRVPGKSADGGRSLALWFGAR